MARRNRAMLDWMGKDEARTLSASFGLAQQSIGEINRIRRRRR